MPSLCFSFLPRGAVAAGHKQYFLATMNIFFKTAKYFSVKLLQRRTAPLTDQALQKVSQETEI